MKDKKIFKIGSMEVKASDDDKREVIAIASKEVADRDKDIVTVGKIAKEGIDIRGFIKNPVVLFAHDHRAPPIARAEKVWKENKKLMMKIKFPEPEVSSLGDSIYKLIKGDYLNSLSIGFQPDWKTAKFNEKRGGYDFPSSELLEVSIVSVPANPAAVIQSKSIKKALDDKVIDEVEFNEMKLYLEELVKEVDDEDDISVFDELEEKIDDLFKKIEEEPPEPKFEPVLDPVEDLNIEQKQNICIKCGGEVIPTKDNIQEETDGDLFEWIFDERLTEKSNDDSTDDLVDELLIMFENKE